MCNVFGNWQCCSSMRPEKGERRSEIKKKQINRFINSPTCCFDKSLRATGKNVQNAIHFKEPIRNEFMPGTTIHIHTYFQNIDNIWQCKSNENHQLILKILWFCYRSHAYTFKWKSNNNWNAIEYNSISIIVIIKEMLFMHTTASSQNLLWPPKIYMPHKIFRNTFQINISLRLVCLYYYKSFDCTSSIIIGGNWNYLLRINSEQA